MTSRINIGVGKSICYDLSGEGPTVCLMSTLAGSWFSQVQRLRERYTVLTYDMRGFGRSVGESPYYPSNEEHSEDLQLILDKLGLNSVVLVGLSHGGAVSQHFAFQYPQYLKGLSIVSSFAKPSGSTSIFLNLLHGFLVRNDLDNFWEVLRAFLYSEKNIPKMMKKEKALKRLMFNQYDSNSLEHIYACSLSHDTTNMLPAINLPTLVVGGKEDLLFPPRITNEISSLIPNSTEILMETAHIPPVESPDVFLEILEDFMESL